MVTKREPLKILGVGRAAGGVFIVIITFCLIYSCDAAASLRRVSHIGEAEAPQRLARPVSGEFTERTETQILFLEIIAKVDFSLYGTFK